MQEIVRAVSFRRMWIALTVLFAVACGGATIRADEPADDPAEPAAKPAAAPEDANPFPQRLKVPDFPRDAKWLNTSGPLRLKDLEGKFVLLDFWTYCCINCMHILPELKKLEQAYPNNLVVIGVHSAKFDTEKDSKNIEEAILRYEIEHPVLNDADHEVWNGYGVQSWPSLLLIDPQGMACWGRQGEVTFDQVNEVLKAAIPYYRKQKLLDETPIRFDLLAERQEPTPLRFPGKLLADEAGGRLFISDSNHNRIVIASLDGKFQSAIGSGAIGSADGDFSSASFDHPQGMALAGDVLYVADTENHLLRKVDLPQRRVTTIAGTGEQARGVWPGLEGIKRVEDVPERFVGPPKKTPLNSPWALWVHGDDLFIAMAGPHQIWKMPRDESEIGPYAGNGREDIVDGPLLPPLPFELGFASFAQPSGLSSDGTWLFVADSEGSSIRAVPFDPSEKVRTIIGTADEPQGRLFLFGDRDGPREQAMLQHPLDVAFHDGMIYVADTYNNKIKAVDAKTGAVKTLAGTGKPGRTDRPAAFDEPEGLAIAGGKLYVADTNNHLIRTIDLATGKVGTLAIAGLTPPAATAAAPSKPSFANATQIKSPTVTLARKDGKITLVVQLELAEGWKINPAAPMRYLLESTGEGTRVSPTALGLKAVAEPAAAFEVAVPIQAAGQEQLKLSLTYYYCQDGGEGLCKIGSAVWTIPITIADSAKESTVVLKHKIEN